MKNQYKGINKLFTKSFRLLIEKTEEEVIICDGYVAVKMPGKVFDIYFKPENPVFAAISEEGKYTFTKSDLTPQKTDFATFNKLFDAEYAYPATVTKLTMDADKFKNGLRLTIEKGNIKAYQNDFVKPFDGLIDVWSSNGSAVGFLRGVGSLIDCIICPVRLSANQLEIFEQIKKL